MNVRELCAYNTNCDTIIDISVMSLVLLSQSPAGGSQSPVISTYTDVTIPTVCYCQELFYIPKYLNKC